MSERDSLVEALVAEVLGPRLGVAEVMSADEDPLDEYIVGVLAPATSHTQEVDADEELLSEGELGADDDEAFDPGVSAVVGSLPSLNLDPMSRPASMGISMSIEAENVPVIDVCGTWARYEKDRDGRWLRRLHGHVWRGHTCSPEGTTLTFDGDPEVSLRIRSRQDRSGTWQVSLFLVNDTQSDTDRPKPEEHVYQPQLRVLCRRGKIVPVERQKPSHDPEEESLALLYQDMPTLARGHLCSAVWRTIDPERPHSGGLKGTAAPFVWIDGLHLFDTGIIEEFSPADIRSEFVPVVPVNAPSAEWRESVGPSPERDPMRLSELTDGDDLARALTPLALGYERWINDLGTTAQPAPGSIAESHLTGCRRALTRILDGIELLREDEDARLAFCFANRAIALQSEWSKGRVNAWRPFQLAFILLNLRAMVDEAHPDRGICDLLWFPTGGGKTEAYLGLAAFTLAHRRLLTRRGVSQDGGAGVTVLSRYTLRLLTIQQYRRALALITACEHLRTEATEESRGWRPRSRSDLGDLPWGAQRFSIGLWVGGGVTPNNLQDFTYKDLDGRLVTRHGAISILEGEDGEGDPAQVLNCPACRAVLAIPADGVRSGESTTLHFVVSDINNAGQAVHAEELSHEDITVTSVLVSPHHDPEFSTVSITLTAEQDIKSGKIDSWFSDHVLRKFGESAELVSARATRPGYFVRSASWGTRRSRRLPVDFEIYCPNPTCVLNNDIAWSESTPAGDWPVQDAFRNGQNRSARCPIPALTVDEQVYGRCPSMVVATVDKFARLAYEPRAGAIFGNVDRFNEHLGYFRSWSPPSPPTSSIPAKLLEVPTSGRNFVVAGFRPPALILQDELHLIEGPLGSMVGLYETGIDLLATDYNGGGSVRPKYVASTATVKQAADQVRSLFSRDLEVFPPPGLRADDSFFSLTRPSHPLDSDQSGRLYVGLIAPGRGAQTPLVRSWSRLLQTPHEMLATGGEPANIDPFWTLVGYFNAIRELAGAVALVRQDIIQRLSSIAPVMREIMDTDPMELSSRADSLNLPTMLEELTATLGSPREPVNVVVATSMFGTGVDVDRLGLMFVNGQPKTTSSYIQATGRVGRSRGGLVVTFFRATRPRDLSHYEYFAGYHTSLYRHVEPVTVNPFAPRARDRALGPVAVSVLRQARLLPDSIPVGQHWRIQQYLNGGQHSQASEMADQRTAPDVSALPHLFEKRASQQPEQRRPTSFEVFEHTQNRLDSWENVAQQYGNALLFHEGTLTKPATSPVVLGDLAHKVARTGQAYENAPTSLREVEPTTTVRGR
ncbi:DISARM system helicase DrmA [Nonomuraea sp. NPDC049649]|uniref:DISARM system helicase DrmA n=1 Tax=Nonomuraea sp. NPDC049649 TaxID=3155776 RepID=UPI00344289D7